jgi:AcrR family transcriptional regulator
VPSENDVESEPVDRRTRKREARRDQLLELAADLVDERGIDGLTMAALAEVADYAPASLYTYFGSRSALLAALQQQALGTLAAVAEAQLRDWDARSTGPDGATDGSGSVAALARLCAFSDLLLAAPELHPREFRLQQQLLVTSDVQSVEDAASVLPAALHVLEVPRRLLAAAAEVGALDRPLPATDPADGPLDGAYVRTLVWVSALNGALLADGLTVGLPTTGATLGTELTDALLRGWGASPDDLRTARRLSAGWVR